MRKLSTLCIGLLLSQLILLVADPDYEVMKASIQKAQEKARSARAEADKIEADETAAAFLAYEEAKTPPDVSIAFDKTEIDEDGGQSGLVARLSKAWGTDVTVDFGFSGTAGPDDYSVSAMSVVIPAGQTGAQTIVTGLPDDAVEERESVIATVAKLTGGRNFIGGDAALWLKSYDLPPNPEFPPPCPIVSNGRPRLLWPNDIAQRVAAAPAVWLDVIKYANQDNTDDKSLSDRCLCGAAIWRIGKIPGFTYKYSAEDYRDRAIAALTKLCAKPINLAGSHYNYYQLMVIPLGYDWLWNDLNEVQRATARGRIVEALTTSRARPLDLFWNGYNQDSGLGMILAISIHGETEFDWVGLYWTDNWWSTPLESAQGVGGYYNREFELKWFGAGYHEGWGYFANKAPFPYLRAVLENATGDKSLGYSWFRDDPLMLLHGSWLVPQAVTSPKPQTYRPFAMPTNEYGGEYWTQPGFAYILAAHTGSDHPKIAALSAWLLSRWPYAKTTGCEELVFKCMVGDPRVKPQSPAELNLPLEYTTELSGYHFVRTGWDDSDIRLHFGCGELLVRSCPRGDVMVWADGPLLACRTSQYSHHFSGPERMNTILLRDEAGIIPADQKTNGIVKRLGGSTTPVRKRVNSFKKSGDAYVAEFQGLYPKRADLIRRTWKWNPDNQEIDIFDEVKCADGLVPLIVWNTPLRPVADDSGIEFTNGKRNARMEFDRQPKGIAVRGGETDDLWCQIYDGSLYEPGGIDQGWKTSPPAQQILEGGYYAAYVTPAQDDDGVWRIRTKILIR